MTRTRKRLAPSIVLLGLVAGLVSPGPGRTTAGEQAPPGVSDVPRRTILKHARVVDRLVTADLRRQKISPNDPADDATFVRRIYLDGIGRVPTVEEIRSFLESPAGDKRADLIDRLLDSPGASSHMSNWWADLLRARSRLASNVSGEPYIHWIRESLDGNKPYDAMVRELLTAEGPGHERGNGATGYYLRDRGMPLDNMANTMRIFLGTRLECAQCHNHPYDRWTQKQFYEIAAFTGGMQYRNAEVDSPGRIRQQLGRDDSMADMEGGVPATAVVRAAFRILQPVTHGISGNGTGMIRLPKDYQYPDAKPRAAVKADVPFGDRPDLAFADERESKRSARGRKKQARRQPRRPRPIDSRGAFADWMTDPDNPRFTRVIANRMWKLVMGRGLIEPVDDLRDDTRATNPRLLDQLEKLMVELDYDLDQFRRVLFHTEAYQREVSGFEPAPGDPYHFEGPLLRRMTAEQIWDSLLTLAVPDVDANLRDPAARAEPVYAEYDELKELPMDLVREKAQARALRQKDPEAYRQMLRMEGETRRQKRNAEAKDRRKKRRDLQTRLKRARKSGDREAMKAARDELASMRAEDDRQQHERSMRGLVRASELPSPAPPGHFLQEFGQSDREQIQAAHQEASIPQALNLLNGFVQRRILDNKYATLIRSLDEASGIEDKIRSVYLGILARPPSEAELELWKGDVERDGKDVYRDLIWTLLNSHEFLFIQ